MALAAVDIGLKRIGIALHLTSDIVTPLEAILRKNRNQAAKEITQRLQEWEVKTLIVGFPQSSQEMQRRIKHFVGLIDFGGKIVYQNEDMSSMEAEQSIKGEIKHKRDGRIDSLAAKIILERYLASRD